MISAAASAPLTTSKLDDVAGRLEREYGARQWEHPHRPPLDELILTVLSQHTSDVNADRAFRSLRARYPTWEAVRTAPVEAVVDAIRSGGLADVKARRIQGILDAIFARRGSLTLDDLAALPLAEARRRLLALHGVGPKTAACVLLFSLGQPALPVDTHVHRVARRLGLIEPTIDATTAHERLQSGLGANRDRVYAFHLNMIAHGRAVCRARRPRCARCVLADRCDYYAATATRTSEVLVPRAPTTPCDG